MSKTKSKLLSEYDKDARMKLWNLKLNKKGFTFKKIAQELGISETMLSFIVTDTRAITADKYEKLKKYL